MPLPLKFGAVFFGDPYPSQIRPGFVAAGPMGGVEWPSIERQLYRYGRNNLVAAAKNDQRDNARCGRKGTAA